ncbi:nodulation protein NfeD [Motiliproteus sp. MSK22-1]|uniref:NfeD family protein n=1 Tax=Motiliproteus sp. MSK22-1 TaxID=1897630 RepID=UPI0009788AA9|nr:nodulation protein NfeD [Motiliproteus sp. MSK22-1]OMH25840.1 serine protease [Motiliproteus sp. MSK22-1]
MCLLSESGLRGHWLLLYILAILLLLLPRLSFSEDSELLSADNRPQAWSVKLSGGIGPASSDYLIRALEKAAKEDIHLLIIEMDTPGGLDKSMRAMIKKIIASPVPVATFVYPSGSRAASAGTYILYASHIAAMAPATNLGAASPVQIGAPALPGTPQQPAKSPQQSKDENLSEENPRTEDLPPEDSATTMRRKVLNDATAYIRGLAELHNRNADWAEKAVRGAKSLSAEKAVELGVVDLIATDLEDLTRQLDGRTVRVQNQDYLLKTRNIEILRIEPDWRSQFLVIITNPNIAYILMLIGVYGLLLEFYNPGVGVPGIVGGISLLVALYAFQLLPISYIGLALILFGIALMSIEALSPSFGIFGFGGAVSFAIGSVMLMDSDLPGYQIAVPVIAAFTVFSLLLTVVILALALKARKGAMVSGDAVLVGQWAIAIEDFQAAGKVRVQGEIWNARCQDAVRAGEPVFIQAIEGLTLRVSRSGE